MRSDRSASTAAIWVALGLVYVIWGSTYLAIAIAVQTLPPLLSAGLRFCIAGLVVLGFVATRRGGVHIRRDQLLGASVLGLLLLVGGNGFVVLAERTVPSGLAALIIASVPFWIVVLRRLSGEKVHPSTFAGVAVGFGGVAFLVIPRGSSGETDPFGLAMLLVASTSWALGSFLAPRLRLPRDGLLSTALQQLAGGIALGSAGAVTGELGRLDPATFSSGSLLALAYLIVFGSLVGFTAYSWLLQHAPVSLVATYAYVNPVVAVLLGAIFLAEPITPSILLGAAIIVAAVAFIVSREGARQRTTRAAARAAAAGTD